MGRHDQADAAEGLLRTGPIVIRGVTRGVRGALSTARSSRHREAVAHDRSTGRAPVRETDPESGEDAPMAETPVDEGSPDSDRPDESVEDHEAAPAPAIVKTQQEDEPRGSRRGIPVRRPARPLGERLPQGLVGVIVLAVIAVVCAGLIVAVVVKTRNDAAIAQREAAAYTPPPLTSSFAATSTQPVIAVIGDQTVSSAASGVAASARWTALLARSLDARVVVLPRRSAGYTAGGDDDFGSAVAGVPAGATAVVFVGGAADAGTDGITLAKAASATFSDASQQAPDAALVVVAPLYRPSGTTAADLTSLRAALRSTAALAEARFVDPVRSGWLDDVDAVGDLDAANEQRIATRMEAVLEPLLDES